MVIKLPEVFDSSLINNVHISKTNVDYLVNRKINAYSCGDKINQWLLKAVTLIDLTTLSGDDTPSNVFRLCSKAAKPLPLDVIKKLDLKKEIRTAAVCVYPNRVPDAFQAIKNYSLLNEINIASVATGFPSGQYPIESKLIEIKFAISKGANEIDVVLDRSLVLTQQWEQVFKEVKLMKEACGQAHLKVILAVGELGTYENVYKASMVSMLAGADFIKTSTGKEAVNATLPVGLVMCRAIKKFYHLTGRKVGLKPAGGIKTVKDTLDWLKLVYIQLGPEWLNPQLFRIGASSLLDVIVEHLKNN